MVHGLSIRRAAECEIAGLKPIINGVIEKAGMREMVRHDFRLIPCGVWKFLRQRVCDPAVQSLAGAF